MQRTLRFIYDSASTFKTPFRNVAFSESPNRGPSGKFRVALLAMMVWALPVANSDFIGCRHVELAAGFEVDQSQRPKRAVELPGKAGSGETAR